jgi:hypothetical protein
MSIDSGRSPVLLENSDPFIQVSVSPVTCTRITRALHYILKSGRATLPICYFKQKFIFIWQFKVFYCSTTIFRLFFSLCEEMAWCFHGSSIESHVIFDNVSILTVFILASYELINFWKISFNFNCENFCTTFSKFDIDNFHSWPTSTKVVTGWKVITLYPSFHFKNLFSWEK